VFRLALQWGILDPIGWAESLPDGALTQWLAWEQIEPIGEQWKQTAGIIHAINVPLYARTGQELPTDEDFMPDRYKRPKRKLSSQLFQSPEQIKQQAERAKAMFLGDVK
jgi:hypothetical protein